MRFSLERFRFRGPEDLSDFEWEGATAPGVPLALSEGEGLRCRTGSPSSDSASVDNHGVGTLEPEFPP